MTVNQQMAILFALALLSLLALVSYPVYRFGLKRGYSKPESVLITIFASYFFAFFIFLIFPLNKKPSEKTKS